MALNLSRNTKVFVSSVNGVVANSNASRGGVKSITTLGGTTSGTYAVGDVLTLQGGTNSDEMKVIVKTISGSDVESVYIPNNFRGNDFTDGETLSQTATTGTATGFTAVVDGVSANGKTADGSRNGLGVFKGNESNANTFKIGVLDGYSFSQASENTDITVSEAGATPNRTSRRFNDSLAPAEWSFQTYARPFVHGTNSFRDSGQVDMVENILWAALAGQSITKAEDDVDTTQSSASTAGATTNGAIQFTSTTADVNFVSSDAHELLKLNIFFALENTTYRLNECQVNQVEIDFSIDGIATLSWSGNATTIDQVSEIIEDPSKVLSTDGTTDTGNTDGTYAEKYNYVDVTDSSDADYLKNKLSQLSLSTAEQGGGASAGGLAAKTYSVNITGGSITIANNITYLTPETLGIVDKPIGSFTGARNVTGSLTCYLDTKTNGSNDLLKDLTSATSLIQPSFDMSLFMGNASGTAPNIELDIPRAMLSIPTVEVADVISTTVEFAALPADTLTAAGDYDMQVKYKGSTTFSDTGYADTSAGSTLAEENGGF